MEKKSRTLHPLPYGTSLVRAVLSYVTKAQAILLNAFFGILINTAYGIAQQVNSLLIFFANTIVRAIRPQIIKSEGRGDRTRMLQLSYTTCKITSLMVAILAIPLYI